jgi:hypothetical protein
MKGTKDELRRIQAKMERLKDSEKAWLLAAGWKEASDAPGSLWLYAKRNWQKEADARAVLQLLKKAESAYLEARR